MDLLQGVRDADTEGPVIREEDLESTDHPMGDFKMPSKEKLLELLESMNMSEEDKEEIRQGVLKNIHQRMEDGRDQHVQMTRILIVIFCVLAIISIFVFFGYKLYRSQTEKERKREEKKKQKQQKKKHK